MRARELSGLDCEGPFAAAARQVVEIRADELFECSRGVLDLDDVEPVHDMRVATRRLRAAMEVFAPCFDPSRHRKARKRVKALADALGERRDRDVTIEFLANLEAEAAEDERAALMALIAELREEQALANEMLKPFVDPRRLEKLRRRLRRLAESAGEETGGAAGFGPDAPLRACAAGIVSERLERLTGLAEPALDPSAAAAQHEMRIAAKRLRYVLEIVKACFSAEGKAARVAARDLQGVLGEIHDCDVMLPRVAGMESLQALLRMRRELLFRRFVELWQAEAKRGTWTALEAALVPPGA